MKQGIQVLTTIKVVLEDVGFLKQLCSTRQIKYLKQKNYNGYTDKWKPFSTS